MQSNALEELNISSTPGKIVLKGALVQLFFTHALTGGIILTIVSVFMHQLVSMPLSIIGVVVLSGALGLLLTANISSDLHRTESILKAMLHGQRTIIPSFSWTFTRLFADLRELDRRVQIALQKEQAAAEIRYHYLEQASEAATLTERQRIARDLHDSIKQQLFSISISAATSEAYWDKDTSRARRAIADIQRVAKEAQVEMQALLQELSSTPLGSTRLADALRVQAEALKYRSELEIELNLDNIPAAELLPERAQETIFRLVQEAFANIARHARAKTVAMTLRQTESALHLIISDNGKGFDVNTAHAGMGLRNMRERIAALNGTIEVRSAPGQGTSLHIIIPLLQLETPGEDAAHTEQEIRREIERATKSFQIGGIGQGIAIFFFTVGFLGPQIPVIAGLQIPVIALSIGLLVVLYGLLRGHFGKRWLIAQRGKEHREVLALQQREEKLYGNILVTLFIGGCLYLSANSGWEQFPTMLFVMLFFGLLIVLAIIHQWRRYHTRAEVYRALAPDEARLELTGQRRRRNRNVNILIAVGVSALVSQWRVLFDQFQTGVDRWNEIVWILFFLCVCVYVLFDAVVLYQRRRALEEIQEKESVDSTLLGE